MPDLSSLTRDQTHAPAVEARSLNPWTARKVPVPLVSVGELEIWCRVKRYGWRTKRPGSSVSHSSLSLPILRPCMGG